MTECAHRWRIAEPDGRREVPGVCVYCGAARSYLAGEPELSKRDMQESSYEIQQRRQRAKGAGQ